MTALTDTGRRPTYADIEALPDHLTGEILGGELIVSPRPAAPHVNAASVLGALLVAPFQLGIGGPGGWWISHEPELSLGVDNRYDPVIPDLAGWRLETMAEFPVSAQFHVVPDWVCEILSPSTARIDRVRKLPFYARAGISHAWLIDPLLETLEVYRLVDGAWRYVEAWSGDATVRAEPFEAVELPLATLWGRKPPESEPSPVAP